MKPEKLVLALLSFTTGFFVAVVFRRRKDRRNYTGWPVNVAHRGSSIVAPENTLQSFQQAIDEGAVGLELDVHLSRDGEVVVIHDDTVDRTTDGSGLIREKLLSEITPLDAGYWFSRDGGYSHPYRGAGVKPPTLREVYWRFPEARVNAEIKGDVRGIEEAVLRVIEDAGAEGRTLVASQKHGVNKRFRQVSGEAIPTSASQFEIGLFYWFSRLWIESLLKPAYTAIQIPRRHLGIELLTPRLVAAAHDRGVRIDVWTVDDPDEMNLVLDFGVDVIMTNRPRTLTEVLEQRCVGGGGSL
ncbi:glycerophosphodiester phosphodiesterase [soil metagenome]